MSGRNIKSFALYENITNGERKYSLSDIYSKIGVKAPSELKNKSYRELENIYQKMIPFVFIPSDRETNLNKEERTTLLNLFQEVEIKRRNKKNQEEFYSKQKTPFIDPNKNNQELTERFLKSLTDTEITGDKKEKVAKEIAEEFSKNPYGEFDYRAALIKAGLINSSKLFENSLSTLEKKQREKEYNLNKLNYLKTKLLGEAASAQNITQGRLQEHLLNLLGEKEASKTALDDEFFNTKEQLKSDYEKFKQEKNAELLKNFVDKNKTIRGDNLKLAMDFVAKQDFGYDMNEDGKLVKRTFEDFVNNSKTGVKNYLADKEIAELKRVHDEINANQKIDKDGSKYYSDMEKEERQQDENSFIYDKSSFAYKDNLGKTWRLEVDPTASNTEKELKKLEKDYRIISKFTKSDSGRDLFEEISNKFKKEYKTESLLQGSTITFNTGLRTDKYVYDGNKFVRLEPVSTEHNFLDKVRTENLTSGVNGKDYEKTLHSQITKPDFQGSTWNIKFGGTSLRSGVKDYIDWYDYGETMDVAAEIVKVYGNRKTYEEIKNLPRTKEGRYKLNTLLKDLYKEGKIKHKLIYYKDKIYYLHDGGKYIYPYYFKRSKK